MWFYKKDKETPKELYEVTENVDLQKGQIRLLMQDGREYFEDIVESVSVNNASRSEESATCWEMPEKRRWYQGYKIFATLTLTFNLRIARYFTDNLDQFSNVYSSG